MNDHDHVEDHNSDSEFDPSEHSDDDISMSDDSDDGDNIQIDPDDSTNDDIPIVLINREDINDNNVNVENEDDAEAETEVEDEEEDEVVAAFIAASSARNRNHPPNLSVGNFLIGGFSFHPNTNILALGLSNGDISM